MSIELKWIQHCVRNNFYRYSLHAERERMNDDLTLDDVEESLFSGRILEQYKDTGRGESCLVVGFSNTGQPVHSVCGELRDQMVLITVYLPTPPKFINPFERV